MAASIMHVTDAEKGGSGFWVYITSSGNRFHTDPNCAALRRNVKSVKLSEVSDRHCCSRCAKQDDGGKSWRRQDGFIILCFLLPAATDLLFHNVPVCWLIGCTVIAMIWNFFCGCEILDLVFCLFPGMIVWLLARFSKGIGMGDVLCIFLLGAGCGVEIGLEILFVGSILCLCAQLMQRVFITHVYQKEIPFVPWLLVSICINCLIYTAFISK